MDKREYIKKLKQLIKKYHPDLCSNGYLESMYNEITRILVNKLNKIREDNDFEINKITEKDYLYYKSGIKYYKNIHPNKFYKRNEDSTFKTKTYKELVSALNKIYLSFNISEYYFYKIINEYPKSPYFQDSSEKIKLLKKLYKSYENIILEENKTINSEKYMMEMGLKML
ncbi:MAG: hypothetical protein FWC19_03970 [Treponema sp.]|nr:hypothetical protein [Treponema sp.]